LVKETLRLGVRKVYATVRDRSIVSDMAGIPVFLDVTDLNSAARAAMICGDVDILINAGIMAGGPLLGPQGAASVQRHLAVNAIGMLSLSQVFAPFLKKNGGGAIVNLLSVLSWLSVEQSEPYSVSKAAAWGSQTRCGWS
jgi:NAD(P)-dependent dehydrogenase (short-subunit alcohol dehydrogenase family)